MAIQYGINCLDELYNQGKTLNVIKEEVKKIEEKYELCNSKPDNPWQIDIPVAKKELNGQFIEIKRIYREKCVNSTLDAFLKWLDEDVMDGVSERILKQHVKRYMQQKRDQIKNGQSNVSMSKLSHALQKKESQLCKIIRARDKLETSLNNIKKIIKQPWDDMKTSIAIQEGLLLCYKFQNTYYPAHHISNEWPAFPKTQNHSLWKKILPLLRVAASESVDIKCIQHYIDFVIRVLAASSVDSINKKITAPNTYTPDQKDEDWANAWMDKPKRTKLDITYANQ